MQYETSVGDNIAFSIRCNEKENRPFVGLISLFVKKYVDPKRGDTVSYTKLASGEKVAMFHIQKRIVLDEIELSGGSLTCNSRGSTSVCLSVPKTSDKVPKCDVCSSPGIIRNYPGPVPHTGCWCPSCNNRLGKIAARGTYADPKSLAELAEIEKRIFGSVSRV